MAGRVFRRHTKLDVLSEEVTRQDVLQPHDDALELGGWPVRDKLLFNNIQYFIRDYEINLGSQLGVQRNRAGVGREGAYFMYEALRG